MVLTFFIKGVAVGFSIAAPVGPIGVLCIRRSLVNGKLIGFATGLGAATADAAYGAVAGFSLTAISNFLIQQKFWLNLIGGVFLCFLGIRIFASKPANQLSETQAMSLITAYASTLFLTLTNPATILSFVAVFAGLGLATTASYGTASSLVFGVFFGSALWWLILSGTVETLRSRLSEMWLQTVNRLSGCTVFSFGIYSFWIL